MSTRPYPRGEKRAPGDGDLSQTRLEFLKEFKHTKAGVWDVYEQISYKRFGFDTWISDLARKFEVTQDLPFVWRMVKDVVRIESCWFYLSLYILVKALASLVPAIALWFTSQYLIIVQAVMTEGSIDENLFIFASTGRICCKIAEEFLKYWEYRFQFPIGLLVKEHADKEVFGVLADLDVPTFEDKFVKQKINRVASGMLGGQYGVIWKTLSAALGLFFSIVRLLAELCVLATVIGGQRDGVIFAIIHVGQEAFKFFFPSGVIFMHGCAFAAVTTNEHYIKLPGIEGLLSGPGHRQEVVAGNAAEFLKTAYNRAYAHVSGQRASFSEMLVEMRASCAQHIISALVPKSIEEGAEVIYLLKSVAHPETIPVCLAIIWLIQSTTSGFLRELWTISFQVGSIRGEFRNARRFYEIREIQNQVPDGTISFPEDSRSLASGITIEFRNVSFRYPNGDDFVLRNLSFKIEKGQLCVIVGTNGSGKSTVLKLMLRLYDPTEGTILVNGQDIRSLKLSDLRECMTVLFQDYSHFPLTIKDNIGIGDPQNAHDEAKIREAARLGGAEEFISKMGGRFDTYLNRPIKDCFLIPGDAETRSGTKIDQNLFRQAIGCISNDDPVKLSGGQMQRLAVSRMFMRAVLSEEARVGLLLFDEPSAALDPAAEHDLFTRLRKLRGEKTMIFSSHRFGQLTRPADLILYMHDSRIVEKGTHDQLMAKGGKYAELWTLQAQAFL